MLWGLWACLILTVGDCNSVAGGYIWLLGLHLSPAHALFGCPWEQQCSALGPAQRWCCHSGWRYLAEKDWKNVFLPRNEYQRERLKLFFLFVFEMVTLRIEQGWEVALKSCRHYSARVSRWTGETCEDLGLVKTWGWELLIEGPDFQRQVYTLRGEGSAVLSVTLWAAHC